MSFFTKLFKKSKQLPLTRSCTNVAEAACDLDRHPSSSDEDHASAPLPGGPRRRAAGEFRDLPRRAKTSGDELFRHVHESRSSLSSNSDAALDDPVRSKYRQLRVCSRGRHALLFKAVERVTKAHVCLKGYAKLNMTASTKDRISREMEALRAAAGPGVVRLLGEVDDERHHYLVLELCFGSTLIELTAQAPTGRWKEAKCARDVAKPLLEVVASLHAKGIVHRDIKPEHILCHPGGVTLVDFGEAVIKNQRCLNYRTGCPEYSAPEVLNKPRAEDIFHEVLFNGMSEEELPSYDEKVDIWSVGVVLYEALTGCQPFMGDDPKDIQASQAAALQDINSQGVPTFIAKHGLSWEAQQLLTSILQLDPAVRPTAETLLQHPWIRNTPALPSPSPDTIGVPSPGYKRRNPSLSSPGFRSPILYEPSHA